MAVSLKCKDCNSLLRNVKEAQAHNEATGHTNFEESTEPVSSCHPTTTSSSRSSSSVQKQYADACNKWPLLPYHMPVASQQQLPGHVLSMTHLVPLLLVTPGDAAGATGATAGVHGLRQGVPQ